MEKIQFDVAVKDITTRDRRFQSDAYMFLKEALDHTIKALRKEELIEHRHVSGPELLEGLVEHAIATFGPMAVTVLESWGVRQGEDIGAMVFNLIEAGAFGRSEEDCKASCWPRIGRLETCSSGTHVPTTLRSHRPAAINRRNRASFERGS
jgi:uncharacterized repeat protein (TIGR04138 family)